MREHRPLDDPWMGIHHAARDEVDVKEFSQQAFDGRISLNLHRSIAAIDLKKMKLMPYAGKCSGCRICELMCTFHHKGAFGRKASSIQVRRLERKGEFDITIQRDGGNLHVACDLCESEDVPLCVKSCPSGALTVRQE